MFKNKMITYRHNTDCMQLIRPTVIVLHGCSRNLLHVCSTFILRVQFCAIFS